MRLRFEPCPICGGELDADHNLYYFDCNNEWLSELNYIKNYDDMTDPANICDERIWADLDENEKRCMTDDYETAVENVELLVLRCPCGFSFETDAHNVHFPEYHWLDEMKELANRRWTDEAQDQDRGRSQGRHETESERGLQADAQVRQVRSQAHVELSVRHRRRAIPYEDAVPQLLVDPRGTVRDDGEDEEGMERNDEDVQEGRIVSDNVNHPAHYGGKGNVYEAINTMSSETSLEALKSAFGHEEDAEDDE